VNTPIVPVRRLEISVHSAAPGVSGPSIKAHGDPLNVALQCASGTWRVDVSLCASSAQPLVAQAVEAGSVVCVVGDADEVRGHPSSTYANATTIVLDLKNSTVRLATSLTGLPPVFVFRRDSRVSISCPFLPEAARGSLEADLDGVADTLRWGHPLDGRTLFANLQVVSSNSTATVGSDGAVCMAPGEPWPSLEEFSSLTRAEIVRAQVAAFAEAAGRIRPDNAFMSLSGGLDSRTSLVALLSHGHRPPCATMAGSPDNLDVCLAKAFCEAYGLPHHTVLFGAEFYRRAPELLMRSADLTGGVSCLSQIADLFLYESMPTSFTARVSGNLGNQVGRGGVESLSAYQPSTEVFSREVRARLLSRPVSPWFIPRLGGDDYGKALFGQEVHFWSVANYVAGSSHAAQLTPYADRRLMHLSRAAFARDSELRHPTWKLLRARDLRHRLAGTPKELSFQRQFLAQRDRQASHIPVNWGWRAAGGRSLGWSMTAMASAADAGLIKLGNKSKLLRPAARWASSLLGHRSALADWPRIIRTHLRELALDTFSSQRVRQAGIFDPAALDKMLNEHFSGIRDHQYTVSCSLEIALGISRWA
jgi:asparagine synthetase B (glutamine-hydrolysing)